MIKILLDHGANKTATVEDEYHPIDLLGNDRSRAKDYLKLNKSEKKKCNSSGSSGNGSPTPPNNLGVADDSAYSMMTPSPDVGSVYKYVCFVF